MHRLILAILFLGLVGTGTELLLLEHTKSLRELIPVALIAVSILILVWHVIGRGPVTVRALQAIMALFVQAGLAGLVLHYQSNAEFKLESNPSLTGWALFWAAVNGKSPPALAPGAMIQLGLLGLVYTYQHPALRLNPETKEKRCAM